MKNFKKSMLLCVAAMSLGGLAGCENPLAKKDTPADEPETPQVEPQDTTVHVTSISIGEASISVKLGDTMQLQAEVAPANATNKNLLWSSNNPSVVSVDTHGNIVALALGEASILVQSEDNPAAVKSFTVKVLEDVIHVTGVSLNEHSLELNTTSDPVKLVATIAPENASNKAVSWSSSEASVASVAPDGTVTPLSDGSTIVSVESADGKYKDSCFVTVHAVQVNTLQIGLPIEPSESYKAYLSNKAPNPSNTLAEFTNRDEPYEVGDDNKFSFRPHFIVRDTAQDNKEVDQSLWAFPYTINVLKKNGDVYASAPASDYDIMSTDKCDVKFNTTAINNEYRVVVRVGGFTEEEIELIGEQITTSYDVKVVDGYNVTNELELSYLDTAVDNSYEMGSGADTFYPNFPEFKAEHGLNQNYSPATLVLHRDMHLGKEHLPAEFFCSEADAEAGNWDQSEREAALGTLKDYTYLYSKWAGGKTTLSGNYFTLDWSAIPLIKRTRGKATSTLDKVESHSSFMRLYAGSYEIKNTNFIGNASTADVEEDKARAGGLIGFKTTWANTALDFHNCLGHGTYITVFNEAAWSTLPNHEVSLLTVRDTKLYDAYNCFVYNWGGKVVAENSTFEGCGGPIVIQDHWDNTETYHNFDFDPANPLNGYAFTTKGYVPETTFIDCQLNNYVIGTEAWFDSFGATSVTAQIKQMGDTLLAVGGEHLPRTMVFDTDHHGSSYQELGGADSLFNFIVLNKSAHMEGMTEAQVDGLVAFKHRNGETLEPVDAFNYVNPVECAAKEDAEMANLPGAGKYAQFMGAASTGAPIFETAGGLGMFPGSGTTLYDVTQLPSYEPVTADFINNARENVALYYNGMMLVMGLGTYGV